MPADIARTTRLLGAAMRLTRLVVLDDIPGEWWIKEPLREYAHRYRIERGHLPPWWPYTRVLDCPFCIGLWIAGGVVLLDDLLGQRRSWRLLTAALAMNEVAAHLGARLGDTALDPADD